jgi:hypothetical protein
MPGPLAGLRVLDFGHCGDAGTYANSAGSPAIFGPYTVLDYGTAVTAAFAALGAGPLLRSLPSVAMSHGHEREESAT